MAYASAVPPVRGVQIGAAIELLKPVTWFAPMWAYICGAVSSGAALDGRLVAVFLGVALAGPLVCATSQAVNDWFDRHVDAINEPGRPIPSGRLPGRTGLYIACLWTALSLAVAAALGPVVLAAAGVGLVLAWAYSAPPLRFKRSGWLGPTVVGVSYEGVAWFTGAAAMLGALPDLRVIALAGLYSAGAFGIMVLNDFKAIEGDRRTGVRSLPVALGPAAAAKVACAAMLVPQVVVASCLLAWGAPLAAALVLAGVVGQALFMRRLLADPAALAPWYNATGVTLFVLGMLASAIALRLLP